MSTNFEKKAIYAGDLRFAIVTARWNTDLTSRLNAGARKALIEAGVDEATICSAEVPGAFELPLASQKLANSGRFDAVIALGVVIRGDTPHFDLVAGQAAAGIMQASLNTGIPILFGVIAADTQLQADERAGENDQNKGYEAAVSAIEMARLFSDLGKGDVRQSVAS